MKKILLLALAGMLYIQGYTQTCPTSQNPWTWKTHSKWFHGEGYYLLSQ